MPNITYCRNFPDEADAICIGHNYLLAASREYRKQIKAERREKMKENIPNSINQSVLAKLLYIVRKEL